MKTRYLFISALLFFSVASFSQKTTSYRFNPSREGSRGFVVDYTIYYKVIDAYGVYYSLSFDGTIDQSQGYLFEGKLYSENDIPGLFDGIQMEPGIERATFDYFYFGGPRRGSFTISYMLKNMGGAYGEGASVEGTETPDERKNLDQWTLRVTSIKPTMYASSTVEGRIAKFKKEAESKEQYDNLISQADDDFSNGNYTDARTKYQSAQKLMPRETYPANQIEKITELETKQKEEAAKEEETKSEDKSDARENSDSEEQTQQKTQAELDAERQRQAEERQQKYDEWKQQKDKENSDAAAASAAASVGALVAIGSIIYGDMGKVDTDEIYLKPFSKEDKFRPVAYLGLEIGFSSSVMPMLFPSELNTMINGNYTTINELQGKSAFTVNLEGQFKVGAESEYYGFYGYFNPRVGFSPVFDSFNLTWKNGGGRVYAGLPHAKIYFDYGLGTRIFTRAPLFETEESGSGRTEQNFNKMEIGFRFTTNADDDYRRSHISIGIIQETLNITEEYYFIDPNPNSTGRGKTPILTGYALQWKKDHFFNFYANVYPEFFYTGKTGGSWSTELQKRPTNYFVEVGFIRAIDKFVKRRGS